MHRKLKSFVVKESSVLLSFIGGIFSAIGFTPKAELFEFIRPFIEALPLVGKILFAALPLIITIYGLVRLYRKGKFTGLIAVFFGFSAGMVFPTIWMESIILLAMGLLIGYFAFRKEK
ncbi:MAG TPA: hypothetical protein VJC07_04880 [Candidatus Nanoarchaeia archaeon]|nr:hypothetical protein [Candidatus Nanoarchaeia archaeon]